MSGERLSQENLSESQELPADAPTENGEPVLAPESEAAEEVTISDIPATELAEFRASANPEQESAEPLSSLLKAGDVVVLKSGLRRIVRSIAADKNNPEKRNFKITSEIIGANGPEGIDEERLISSDIIDSRWGQHMDYFLTQGQQKLVDFQIQSRGEHAKLGWAERAAIEKGIYKEDLKKATTETSPDDYGLEAPIRGGLQAEVGINMNGESPSESLQVGDVILSNGGRTKRIIREIKADKAKPEQKIFTVDRIDEKGIVSPQEITSEVMEANFKNGSVTEILKKGPEQPSELSVEKALEILSDPKNSEEQLQEAFEKLTGQDLTIATERLLREKFENTTADVVYTPEGEKLFEDRLKYREEASILNEEKEKALAIFWARNPGLTKEADKEKYVATTMGKLGLDSGSEEGDMIFSYLINKGYGLEKSGIVKSGFLGRKFSIPKTDRKGSLDYGSKEDALRSISEEARTAISSEVQRRVDIIIVSAKAYLLRERRGCRNVLIEQAVENYLKEQSYGQPSKESPASKPEKTIEGSEQVRITMDDIAGAKNVDALIKLLSKKGGKIINNEGDIYDSAEMAGMIEEVLNWVKWAQREAKHPKEMFDPKNKFLFAKISTGAGLRTRVISLFKEQFLPETSSPKKKKKK